MPKIFYTVEDDEGDDAVAVDLHYALYAFWFIMGLLVAFLIMAIARWI